MAEELTNNINLDLEFEKIVPWNGKNDTGQDVRLKLDRNWQRVVDAFNTILNSDIFSAKYIRKDKDDRTPYALGVGGKLTAEGGFQIGDTYVPGILTGCGGYFDEYANGEIESLTIRRELRVPSIVFNQVEVLVGDKWRSPGAGVIERVEPDYNDDGTIGTTGTFWLKLEKGQIGAVFEAAICMGIFHNFDNPSSNATEDTDDSYGNRTYAGFTTSYFTITEVSDYADADGTVYHRKQCRYQVRPVSERWSSQAHPFEQMNFVCYGIFSDDQVLLKKYGTSVYETRTYTRMLINQNTWEISAENIGMQYGDMANMTVHGLEMSGYSAYLNNMYMTGVIKQFNAAGHEIKVANDRGAWVSGTTYDYYDRVSHNGALWLCINESGTNTEPTETDPSWLMQVSSGAGVTAETNWCSADTPYPQSTILKFAEKIWISNKETSEPPFPIYTDSNGNRLTYNDGGYVLVHPLIQSEDWNLLLDASDLVDGADGASLYVRYSADGVNWHDTYVEGDLYMQQRIGEDAVWSDPIRIVGEDGVAKDGKYTEYEFAVGDSETVPPTTGWQDAPPAIGAGQYLWMRMRVVDPNDTSEPSWSIPVRLKGDKGDGITISGVWKPGMTVPILGVVTMGGISFIAKVATTNPPLWCYTDSEGNYLTYADGGYVLTGEENTEEYDQMVQSGKDGKDGTDHEYIYRHTSTQTAPSTPHSAQEDDYIPDGWHDDPLGVSEALLYEWVCTRKKANGVWSAYSTPAIWAKFGEDGANFEFVYTRTTVDEAPDTPIGEQQDDFVPAGWSDDPLGADQEYPFEWMSKRKKTGSVWGDFSAPVHWTHWAKDGEGFTLMGNWYSGLVVPAMGVVYMGGATWVAKVATTNPPLWCYTDSEGNYLTYADGGYVLTGEENTEEYDLWIPQGVNSFVSTVFVRQNTQPSTPSGGSYDNPVPTGWSDGVPAGTAILWASMRTFRSDGNHGEWSTPRQMTDTANFDVEFSSVEKPNPPVGHPNTNAEWSNTATEDTIWMATSNCSNGVWSDWQISKIKGEKGEEHFKSIVFLRSNTQPDTPTGGDFTSPLPTSSPTWSDGVPDGTAILWASTRIFTRSGAYPQEEVWSTPHQMTDTADFEVIYTPYEDYYDIPSGFSKNGVEIDASWLALANDAGWYDEPEDCGSDPIYWATNHAKNGVWQGWQISKIKGESAKYQVIEASVASVNRDVDGKYTPSSFTVSEYTIDGESKYTSNEYYIHIWGVYNDDSKVHLGYTGNAVNYTFTPSGSYVVFLFELRKGTSQTSTLVASTSVAVATDGEKGDKGDQGIQGCIIRQTEWVAGTSYHNDTGLTDTVRYLDVVTVTDEDGDISGIYRCIKSHDATTSNRPGSGTYWRSYWEVFNEMAPIYTSLLLTEYAVMKFGQANQLLVMDSYNDVIAGMSGGSETSDILLWVGGTPTTAPFTVDKYGNMVATQATIYGTIYADNGEFTGTVNAEGGTISGQMVVGSGNYTILIDPSTRPSIKWIYGGNEYMNLGLVIANSVVNGSLSISSTSGYSVTLTPLALTFNGSTYDVSIESNASQAALRVYGPYGYCMDVGVDSSGKVKLAGNSWPTSANQVSVGQVYSDGGTLKVRTS